jgi:hypothetical protein
MRDRLAEARLGGSVARWHRSLESSGTSRPPAPSSRRATRRRPRARRNVVSQTAASAQVVGKAPSHQRRRVNIRAAPQSSQRRFDPATTPSPQHEARARTRPRAVQANCCRRATPPPDAIPRPHYATTPLRHYATTLGADCVTLAIRAVRSRHFGSGRDSHRGKHRQRAYAQPHPFAASPSGQRPSLSSDDRGGERRLLQA